MSRSTWWRTAATTLIAATLALSPLASRADETTDAGVDLGNLSDFVTEPTADLGETWNTGQWFVEFKSRPTVSGGGGAQIQNDRRAFTTEALAAGLPAEVNHIYTRLFNGVTVDATDAEARRLADLDSVKSVHPVLGLRMAANPPSLVDGPTGTALAMIGADRAQVNLGLTGEGIKVGVIDTGIDYMHPDLGGTGDWETSTFPTGKVAYGRDFIGDEYSSTPNEEGELGRVIPDDDPHDCQGHGTHVAGTIAGSGTVVGVAPDATLGAYKAMTCAGDTNMAVILEAMEQASVDGMDVVNMSLGWPFLNSADHPLARAADRMVAEGIVMVIAAGNEGEYGTQTLRSPGSARDVITVGSVDANGVQSPAVVFTPEGGEPVTAPYTLLSETPVPTGFTAEVATFSDALACKPDPDLAGKVAIFSGNGGCDMQRRTDLAMESGAVGVVVFKDLFFWDWVNSLEAPALGVSTETGTRILDALESGPVTLTVPGTFVEEPNPLTPGLASVFTSWGLDSELGLKPDLTAPGGAIYSTMPLGQGGYGLSSGTSMASPHVAGAAALMLDHDAALSPAEIRTRLQNTAAPTVYSFMPDSGVLDAAHRQGAGLIHVDRAVTNPVTVTPSKLAAGQSADGPFRQTLTFTNSGDADVTWTASHLNAVTTHTRWDEGRSQNTPDFTQEAARVTFSAPTVTVPAGGSATLAVTIDAPTDVADTAVYSGFLRFTSGDETLVVPFAGMKGDLSSAPVMMGEDSPWPPGLAILHGCFEWQERRCVDEWPMVGDADPTIPFDVSMLPAVRYVQAVTAATVELTVLQADDEGLPIEDTAQPVSVDRSPSRTIDGNHIAWDGQLVDESGELVVAPVGHYVLRIAVTNFDSPARTDVYTSPAFKWMAFNDPYEEPTPEPSPSPSPSKPAPREPADVYNTPGLHNVGGRQWFTACEPYSQTVRCRTMIVATTVEQKGGVFLKRTGWVFNNLTYLPKMTRAAWGSNPLANAGSFTGTDGRQWRTECDTALTGKNGCRNFIRASVIESVPQAGGGYSYRWVTKEILNSMVRFR